MNRSSYSCTSWGATTIDSSNRLTRKEFRVYLAHAQVIDRTHPPTTYYVAVGLWWTDLFTMSANYILSQQRPRENRPAAYFNTAMFNSAQNFMDHLQNNGPTLIKERIEQEGYPNLYNPA